MLGGYEEDVDALIARMGNNPLLSGLTLSGGDPFYQSEPCTLLAKAAHARGLNVWAYTGFTLEELLAENDAARMALLMQTDVLVDGPFIMAQRSLELSYCGSKNQRLIDVKKTLQTGQVALWQKPVW